MYLFYFLLYRHCSSKIFKEKVVWKVKPRIEARNENYTPKSGDPARRAPVNRLNFLRS